MDQKREIDLEIRLWAAEVVIAELMALLFKLGKYPAADVAALREAVGARLEAETYPGAGAEWSDHVNAELADRVDQLLAHVQSRIQR